MQIKIENNNMIITLPIQAPQLSKTGKSFIVASTGGFTATTAVVDGKPVKINITAIINK